MARDETAHDVALRGGTPQRSLRMLVLSDLHVEVAKFQPPTDGFDVVILAGDIHNGVEAPRWAREAFPHHPIVQIAGNHEFWFARYGPCLDAIRAVAREVDVHFLENDAISLHGVDFLGCTLWTDFAIYERPGRPLAMSAVTAMQVNGAIIRDYRAITIDDAGGARPFAPADALRLHRQSRAWLQQQLEQPQLRPRVVVSHYLPSWRSVSQAFGSAVTNAVFVSDLDALVERADVWIHGHTHSSHVYEVGHCRVVCNPRGYPGRGRAPGEFENPAFDTLRIVEVALPGSAAHP